MIEHQIDLYEYLKGDVPEGYEAHLTVLPKDRPISVVFSDQEALRVALQTHAPGCGTGDVVDVTHNHGRMWRGVSVAPYRVDIEPSLYERGLTDMVADFRALPSLWTASWKVVVFDPPHMTDSSDGAMGSDTAAEHRTITWNERYGLGEAGPKGDNITPLFPGFLVEAHRVLVDGGIVLAKISNMVHAQRYQDQARSFKNIAEQLGFTVCCEYIRVAASRASLEDPKWKHVYHPRTIHSYWIVLRKGQYCYPRERVSGSDRRRRKRS